MDLTPADVQRFFQEVVGGAPCQVCAGTDYSFNVVETPNGSPESRRRALASLRQTVPVVEGICNGCGHRRRFARAAIERWLEAQPQRT